MEEIPYVLDILIKRADMKSPLSELETPMWFVLTADGLTSPPIQSTQAIPGPHPEWNFALRMVLSIRNISTSYLYISLATYQVGNGCPKCIARSKIKLANMPKGTPKQFKFPLMDAENSANVVGNATFLATFTALSSANQVVGGSSPYPYGYAMEPR